MLIAWPNSSATDESERIVIMTEPGQGSELVLMPNEHCFFLNRTDGNVSVVVGPYKHPLSETHRLVEWSTGQKRFVEVAFDRAKRNNIVIPEGWYAPLKNPAKNGVHPSQGGIADLRNADLMVGKKVNIAGPSAFALWPGQMCKVIEGHKLRSNQYLLVRIYDVEAFKAELSIRKQPEKNDPASDGDSSAEVARKTDIYGGIDAENLATGQQFIIKGTDVHFYIPPDGIEVVSILYGDKAKYVQEAVTLEQLQYCILQDENGNKKYVRGPNVVFPEPTEKFLKHTGDNKVASKKFKAIELNEKSGLYIKVIKPYSEGGREYAEGDELFITGEEQKIYFPREEHAVIRYGDQDRYYGVALPKGAGRYVLDRINGGIDMVMGPQMFLPDPRRQVVVKRILTDTEARLLFPGNSEVHIYNASLRNAANSGSPKKAEGSYEREQLLDKMLRKSARSTNGLTGGTMTYAAASSPDMFSTQLSESVEQGVMGDSIDREGQYVPPRSITIDKNRFDGVVAFNVWNGFATMVTDREGNQRVIIGPQRVYLAYDETPEVLRLSMGRPKDHERTIETVFLRVNNNVVGDVVDVETSDLCAAKIELSMHVDFVGETDEERQKWFSDDNYVRRLCERISSLLKNHIRKVGVMEFYSNSTDIVRDIILGEKTEEGRPGLTFEEIGLVVSDVEVLKVNLKDESLQRKMEEEASDALENSLSEEKLHRERDHDKAVLDAKEEIQILYDRAKLERLVANATLDEKEDERRKESLVRRRSIKDLELKMEKAIVDASIANDVARANAVLEADKERLKIQTELMAAEAEKTREVMESISPQLVAAVSALGDNDRVAKLAEAVSAKSVFGDEGVLELMKAQFGALGLDSLLDRVGFKAISDASKVDVARVKESRDLDD